MKNSWELFFRTNLLQVGLCPLVMRINLIKYLTIKFEIFGWRETSREKPTFFTNSCSFLYCLFEFVEIKFFLVRIINCTCIRTLFLKKIMHDFFFEMYCCFQLFNSNMYVMEFPMTLFFRKYSLLEFHNAWWKLKIAVPFFVGGQNSSIFSTKCCLFYFQSLLLDLVQS